MPSPGIPWQSKVARLLKARRKTVPDLAEMLGRSERTVRAWIGRVNQPLGEASILAQIAAALHVPVDWLQDGDDSPVPPESMESVIPDELLRAVPAKLRRLAYALLDPDTGDWMLAQLDLYERAQRARGRASR